MIPIRLRLAVGACLCAMAVAAGGASAEVRLGMDQVRLVRFKAPFKAVSVGNSLIADATVVDERHVLVTGREFGTTNLVAVDEEGNQVADELITVTTQQGAMVTVTRGSATSYTLTCNGGRCDTRPTPGDDITKYKADTDAITVREGQSVGAASISSPNAQ